MLRRTAQLAESHFDEIVGWIVRESGSTRAKAAFETSVTVKALHEASGLPSRSAGDVLPSTPGRLSLARRRPLGVIGVISPFNFPLYLAVRAVAPAVALGASSMVIAHCAAYSMAFPESPALTEPWPSDAETPSAVSGSPSSSYIQIRAQP
ncbi:Malonate-semialdehyde dehydrogenase [Paraburkholderia ultramafica]|uniref:Malonate-semialdehyde dehydrogenase n=1 Tax=Paraburkholderia ultramafica TaxID=1544867 RepID=A0A6S7CMC0_9BURK|nr:Malonate-semialdehyde dehydrogenase [Paraburkholderia ultramafica]